MKEIGNTMYALFRLKGCARIKGSMTDPKELLNKPRGWLVRSSEMKALLPEPTTPTIVQLCLHSITWLFPGLSGALDVGTKVQVIDFQDWSGVMGMRGREIVFQK